MTLSNIIDLTKYTEIAPDKLEAGMEVLKVTRYRNGTNVRYDHFVVPDNGYPMHNSIDTYYCIRKKPILDPCRRGSVVRIEREFSDGKGYEEYLTRITPAPFADQLTWATDEGKRYSWNQIIGHEDNCTKKVRVLK